MKKLIAMILIQFSAVFCYSQKNELGAQAGVSYYLGDLNPALHFLLSKPAAGIVYRYNHNDRVSFRLNGLYGQLIGDDAVSKENVSRNLRFRSSIIDISSVVEINFLPFTPGVMERRYTTYIFGGLGLAKFNPKSEVNNAWIELQPLATEGQPEPYKRTTLTIPFGIGCKFNLNPFVTIGLEWGLRKLFTDYLDDVSGTYRESGGYYEQSFYNSLLGNGQPISSPHLQRGNSQTKDWYSFAGMLVTVKIRNKQKPCGAYQTKINVKRTLH